MRHSHFPMFSVVVIYQGFEVLKSIKNGSQDKKHMFFLIDNNVTYSSYKGDYGLVVHCLLHAGCEHLLD